MNGIDGGSNVIDPTNYRQVSSPSPWATDEELGRDDFLRLLVAQMEHQDPLQPQKDAEFIAQLATFSSLEQLVDLNGRMETLTAAQQQMAALQGQLLDGQALALIGREVLVDTGGELMVGPEGAETVAYELVEPASSLQMTISDASGQPVRVLQLDDPADRGSIRWDGLDHQGNPVEPGSYRFELTATAGGRQVDAMSFVALPVEAVHVGAEGLALVSGRRTVSASQIVQIRAGEQPESETTEVADAGPRMMGREPLGRR
jgi:flagellar basal-body rod modification protein FlgD